MDASPLWYANDFKRTRKEGKKRSVIEQPTDRPEMRRELISGPTNIVKLLVA